MAHLREQQEKSSSKLNNMANDNHDEAHLRNLMRFVHAQDSGGIYEGTGTYAQALQEVKAGISGGIGYGMCFHR